MIETIIIYPTSLALRLSGMTPHISGSTLSAQSRYAAGVREILECWLNNKPIRSEYIIVDGGRLAGAGTHAYSAGNATGGSEEVAEFRSYAGNWAKPFIPRTMGIMGIIPKNSFYKTFGRHKADTKILKS